MTKIVIVDDDELIAAMAANMLCEAGFATGWVPSVPDAKALLKWRRPDLMLLDHDMPGQTGGEFLRELRSSEYHYDLPVIMCTRMAGQADEDAALYNGAQDYLRKPFNKEELLWMVNHQLQVRKNRTKHRDLRDELARSSGQFVRSGQELRAI